MNISSKSLRHRFQPLSILVSLCGFFALCSPAAVHSAAITISWDNATDEEVLGYHLYYGFQSGVYTDYIDTGNRPRYTLEGLDPGETWYFAVTAYTSEAESAYSSEVSFSFPEESVEEDADGDGIPDQDDNCVDAPNPNQADIDSDGEGDLCDRDIDGDGFVNESDNCPDMCNADQSDNDTDGIGDLCDEDIDGDSVPNENDNCPHALNPEQTDADNDGLGDVCDDQNDSQPDTAEENTSPRTGSGGGGGGGGAVTPEETQDDIPPQQNRPECLSDGDCDDGLDCNGLELCLQNQCIAGQNPCAADEVCDEIGNTCIAPPESSECSTDTDCDDNVFCNGQETCVDGTCTPGSPPCAESQQCSEADKKCRDVVPISSATVVKTVLRPLLQQKRCQWFVIRHNAPIDPETIDVAIVGEGDDFQGLSLDDNREVVTRGRFIFVPVCIDMQATPGHWLLLIETGPSTTAAMTRPGETIAVDLLIR